MRKLCFIRKMGGETPFPSLSLWSLYFAYLKEFAVVYVTSMFLQESSFSIPSLPIKIILKVQTKYKWRFPKELPKLLLSCFNSKTKGFKLFAGSLGRVSIFSHPFLPFPSSCQVHLSSSKKRFKAV